METGTTGTAAEYGGDGGAAANDDYKSQMSASDLIKIEMLTGLIAKNVNLSDFELGELTGFSVDKIKEIRDRAVVKASDESERPLTWDYVLAFDVGDKDEKNMVTPKKRELERKDEDDVDEEWENGMTQEKYYGQVFSNFWNRLSKARLAVGAYRSADKQTMFLVVGITENNLKIIADERDTDLLIDAVGGVEVGRLRDFALARRTKLPSDAVTDDDDDSVPQGASDETLDLSLWQNLYGEYSQQADPRVYKQYKRTRDSATRDTVFDEKTRLRIIYESIIADSNEGGAEIRIEECLFSKKHPLKAVFALHDPEVLDKFEAEWIKNWKPWQLMSCPLSDIRNYFGEPVAFYFAFLQFYLRWLIAPAIVGLIFFIWQVAVGKIAVLGISLLCFFMIFWSVAFVDFWARAESRYRMAWGMTKFQQKAVARPQFVGEWTHDSVSGLWTEEFSFFKRAFRISAIYTFVMIWITSCVVLVVVVLTQRDSDPNDLALKVYLGVANAVMIFIFDIIYKLVSKYGNEWENHRTDQDYQNAMIMKSFIFKFVNSFASLFYLSMIRPYLNGLYFWIRFKTDVCEGSGEFMGQFVKLFYDGTTDQNADADYVWIGDNLDGGDKWVESDLWESCTEEGVALSCVNMIATEKPQNPAWKFTTDGFLLEEGESAASCPSLSMNGCDGTASADVNYYTTTSGQITCCGVCDYTDTYKQWNETVLSEVRIQLLTLFLTAIVIQNTLEVGVPFLAAYLKNRKKEEGAEEESAAEQQMEKGRYANTIDDMSEMIIQFGYVTLFVMAFPLTPLLAIVNNIFEMKVDAINLVKTSQRPDPNGSYGLGTWNEVLGLFSVLSVGTNVALITLRSTLVTELLSSSSADAAGWIFFSFLSITLAIIVAIEKWVIPDVPEAVTKAVERQRLVESVLILGSAVDAEGDEPPGDDVDGDIPFNPALEFCDVVVLDQVPTTDLRFPQTSA